MDLYIPGCAAEAPKDFHHGGAKRNECELLSCRSEHEVNVASGPKLFQGPPSTPAALQAKKLWTAKLYSA